MDCSGHAWSRADEDRRRGLVMNLDELAEEILAIAAHDAERQLAAILLEWKGTDETASRLAKRIDDFIREYRDGPAPISEAIKNHWERFKTEAIDGIGGLTMNERLYYFGLYERFDDWENQDEIRELYAKLHATR